MTETTQGQSPDTPSQPSPGPKPTRWAKALFWLAAAVWMSLCVIMTQLAPILTAMQPSLRTGLAIGLAVQIAAIAAANFTAIYPAFIQRGLRSNPLIVLVWLVSVVAAVLADLALLWGTVRLFLYGPSFQ